MITVLMKIKKERIDCNDVHAKVHASCTLHVLRCSTRPSSDTSLPMRKLDIFPFIVDSTSLIPASYFVSQTLKFMFSYHGTCICVDSHLSLTLVEDQEKQEFL